MRSDASASPVTAPVRPFTDCTGTVGIVGLLLKSLYEPVLATAVRLESRVDTSVSV